MEVGQQGQRAGSRRWARRPRQGDGLEDEVAVGLDLVPLFFCLVFELAVVARRGVSFMAFGNSTSPVVAR